MIADEALGKQLLERDGCVDEFNSYQEDNAKLDSDRDGGDE